MARGWAALSIRLKRAYARSLKEVDVMNMRPLLLTPAAALLILACLAACTVACSPSDPPDTREAAQREAVISGRYEVEGVTTSPGSGAGRKIAGTVILVQEGDHYTATFDLKTTYPTQGDPTPADVIGVGEGSVEGGSLAGSAKTQLVVSTVPGIDPGFAFLPRTVSTRIVSSTVADVEPDGSINIELENRAAEGESYEPTRTRLAGHRIPLEEPPPVAAFE
jgi:hypothetical protein